MFSNHYVSIRRIQLFSYARKMKKKLIYLDTQNIISLDQRRIGRDSIYLGFKVYRRLFYWINSALKVIGWIRKTF